MRVTLDTNILIRLAVEDDEAQAAVARELIARAEAVVVTSQSLCEFVWVLSSFYKLPRGDIARAIRSLADAEKTIVGRACVEAGLSMFEQGGDFADGMIVFEGRKAGATRFASFDRKAVRLAVAAGFEADLLT